MHFLDSLCSQKTIDHPIVKDSAVFVYELDIKNWRELWFFLFRSKTCPTCRRKLERVDVFPKFSSGWEKQEDSTGMDIEYAHTTKDSVRYRCDPCHAYYSLTELASKT